MRAVTVLVVLLCSCHREPRVRGVGDRQGVAAGPVSDAPVRSAGRCGSPGRWRDGPLFLIARGGHHARVLPDGRVLVWGGGLNLHADDEAYPAEAFDPHGKRAGTGYSGVPHDIAIEITQEAPPGTPSDAALVRLRDGRLLVAGGADADGQPLRTVTVGGCPAAPMRDARAGAAAVLLRDGRVLITGGRTGGPEEMDPYIRTTEFFTP